MCLRHGFGIFSPSNRNLPNRLLHQRPPCQRGSDRLKGDPGGFVQAVRIRRKPYRITVLRRAESLRVAFSRRPTSAQGISSTNQIKNLGSHLPLTREALRTANSSANSSFSSCCLCTINQRLPPLKGDTGGCCWHYRQIDAYRSVASPEYLRCTKGFSLRRSCRRRRLMRCAERFPDW